MRLNQLEIFGFKSFAQKVSIPFGPGITAIVGPNGCGKSNVVEAIRWVLGEQRAGTFRSHKMEDVIFAGTRNRKPLGMSEVALVIDNTEGMLPVDFSEITLTRRLFRSGESDYLMNKVPCRLLDITNLLMDTGLGQGAYAVMEQGMVDEIVSERTENRRRILEEAAGITKYKTRRRATWSKLESTRADLTRIEDIIIEVKRQVDYLSRQVGRARRYQNLKQELDQLEVLLGRTRFFSLREQAAPLQEEVKALDQAVQEGYTRFTGKEASLEQLRLEETEAERALQEMGSQVNSKVDEIHARDRSLVATRERLEAAERVIERAGREREEYQKQQETALTQHAEATAAQTRTQAQLDDLQVRLEAQEQDAAQVEEEYSTIRAALEKRQHEQMERLRQQGELSRELERLRAESEAQSQRSVAVAAELEEVTAELGSARKEAGEATAALRQVRAGRRSLDAQFDCTAAAGRTAVTALEQLGRQQADLEREKGAKQARLQAVQSIRARYEGYSSGVRTLMLDSPYAALFRGVLGDLLDVDPRYTHAAEAALGDALEALVAQDQGHVLEAIQLLHERKAGRAGIFALCAELPPQPSGLRLASAQGLLGPMSDFVRADAEIAPLVECLLHNTFLVESLDTALKLRQDEANMRLVTPHGDAIDVYGRVVGGPRTSEEASLLGRKQEIRSLRTAIAHQEARLASVSGQLHAGKLRRSVLDRRAAALSGWLEKLREEERELSHRQQRALEDVERHQRRTEQLQSERQRLAAREKELQNSIQLKDEQLRTHDEAARELDDAIRASSEQLRQSEAKRQEQQGQLAAARIERARLAETAQSLSRDVERLVHMQHNLERTMERLDQECDQAKTQHQQLDHECRKIESGLESLHAEREELESERDRRREHWSEVNTQTRELEADISRLQRELNSQRERHHQIEMQLAELQSQSEHIRERLQEEAHCDVERLGPVEEEVDQEAAEQRVNELRQSLARLGSVHLGVLEEHETQKQRYDFLCQQRDDLVVAAEDLTKTLRLIDRTARRMFTETFEQIRGKFRETFARFFSGGDADLKLEPDVDPLEASIDIIARPRGKRLQSISLLSGGERALTAISLLFAIYLVKPSPFCILDEVDAPLDDANIGRFIHVLKEFARSTQFIMVTHNKISMAAADTLHGVTMPEEGVSQLVSVRIDEDDFLEEAAG